MTHLPPFFVQVSKLARFDFCNKAAKIMIFNNPKYGKNTNQKYMETGTRLHSRFSEPFKDFERRVFRYALKARYGKVLSRKHDFYEIRGIPDDFIINVQGNSKYVSIVELKTTHKHRLILSETKAHIFQLQLYVWLLEPLLESLGYRISEHHILEIHSQVTGQILKRFDVDREPDMTQKLTHIFDCFRGLEKMMSPPDWVCRVCSKPVKEACSWHKMRKEAKR